MPTTLRQLVQHQAYILVLLQAACIAVLALIALIVKGSMNGLSVLLGGFAYILPNLIFVWRVFRYVGANQVMQFLSAFYLGEMFKLVISAILFLLIVKYFPVSLLSVLVGYIAAIVSFWVVCMWYFSQPKNTQGLD